uniref:Uncharacterized protein n=1 Tax=Arundo donax TaxID=35708 RepID=A0A0A9FWD6_ARUDO
MMNTDDTEHKLIYRTHTRGERYTIHTKT